MTTRHRSLSSCLGITLFGLTACTPAVTVRPGPTVAPPPKARVSSGTLTERFLPLVDGHLYQYEFETGEGQRGVLTARIQRSDASHGAWLLPGGGNAFVYAEDGVKSETPEGSSYVLKLPLTVGNRWPGQHLTTIEIRRTDASITVPSGSFTNCIETHETRGGDVPLEIVAVFCPDVGMVTRAVASGPKRERLTLKSFGEPVDLGPDGVRVVHED